jgi:hypothetical protein
MRIKKKELLEAINPEATKTALAAGGALLKSAEDLKNTAKPIIGDEGAEKFVNSILEPNTKKELEEDADTVKPNKKRVKEVIKVKNLKK